MFGLVAVTSDVFFTKNFCTSTRGHQYKLYKHHTSACVRSNFFCGTSYQWVEQFARKRRF